MTYYNHFNLDEIAEAMNAPQVVYPTKFIDFPIIIQDISRIQIKVILSITPTHPKKIQMHLESIYSVGKTKFRKPDEFIIFMDFPIFDFFYFHNQILEALDEAFHL